MQQNLRLPGLALGAALIVTAAVAGDVPLTYPATRRVNHTDDYHGTKVPDPYRWLEEDVRQSKEVAAWVAAQNRVTNAYLQAILERAGIKQRLTELWNYEKQSAPSRVAGRYLFTRNDGLQNQAVLLLQETLGGPARVLLDPNTWSKDGTVSMPGWVASDDGKYLAYGRSEAGSDWETWQVLDVDSATTLPDELKWIKYGNAAWTRDGRGFFYGRYPEPKKGGQFQEVNLNQQVYYHRVGTPQASDVLVYRLPEHPEWGFGPTVTEDGRYLVLSIDKGSTDPKNRITYRDLDEPYALPVDLIDTFDNEYTFVGNDGAVFYFKTDLDAPRGRVIAIDTRKPARENWKELIPQGKDNLTAVSLLGNLFVASYLKDASTQVKVHQLDGSFVREVGLPGLGTATGFSGRRTEAETFYLFSSFATPPSIYRYDVVTGASKLVRRSKVKFDPTGYEVEQVFYPSSDGTKVPLFVTHRKGLALDGSNPTLLYGYGGFNVPMTPEFSIGVAGWLELGGVYAQACLRGGGEYGEDWHQAGAKKNKQRVFDDFIAAAEWLIEHKYTRSDKLAVKGESNGGLLIGAVMTQRPGLFGACLAEVGVMDMLRFHQFTSGRFWVDEYGSADDPEQFATLRAYSPYHNVKKGTKYPPTLVMTADTDDRVVPGHSFKFAAALQYAQAGPAPVLARIETDAGHGGGKPTAKQIEEVADAWAFLVKNLKMKVK
jgi:prolyl oligopeptidase